MSLYDLVFEGGGLKGLAYVGALQALEEADIQPRRVIGSSAGAIAALLVQLGYSSGQIHQILTENVDGKSATTRFFDIPQTFSDAVLDQSSLMAEFRAIDIPLVPESVESRIDNYVIKRLLKGRLFRAFFSLVECGGLYAGDTFIEWLHQLMTRRGFAQDLCLAELPTLTIIAADTTLRCKLILNAATAPYMPVAWAVRASMSIPFVWQEVVWQADWGTYLGQDMTGHGLVDGGLCSNFALDQLLAPLAYTEPYEPVPLLGFILDETLAVPGVEPSRKSNLKIFNRMERLLETMREGNDRSVAQRHADIVCALPCSGYGTLEAIKGKKERALIAAALAATKAHLALR